jgi:hypothetical protein
MEHAGPKAVRGVVALGLALLVPGGCKNDDAPRGDTPAGSNMCGEAQAVADEPEIGFFRGRQQGDDRQPGRRMDEFVEAGGGHRVPTRLPSMMCRSARVTSGPPMMIRIAPPVLARVAGCGTPAASKPKLTANVTIGGQGW